MGSIPGSNGRPSATGDCAQQRVNAADQPSRRPMAVDRERIKDSDSLGFLDVHLAVVRGDPRQGLGEKSADLSEKIKHHKLRASMFSVVLACRSCSHLAH